MKKVLFLIVIILMITGCNPSKNKIGKIVVVSMQSTFDTNQNFKDYNLKVGAIEVSKKTNTEYLGLVDIYLGQERHQVSVNIDVDGENITWKTGNGELLFLTPKASS